jgi:hypothetical protein
MSWDLVLQNGVAATNSDALADAACPPLGAPGSVRALISSVHPDVDWSDPAWGVLDSDAWSIEFNMGNAETIDSIMLHVRGSGDPLPAIVALCTKTGWTALDLSTGQLLDPRKPSSRGWMDFQSFRDQIQSLAEIGDPAILRRSRLRLEDATILRSSGREGEQRHELSSFAEVLFDRGTNWASVVLAVSALGLGALLKVVIPIVWLGWLAVILLTCLGLLFAMTARTDVLVLKAASGTVVIPLVDTPAEIRAFKEVLSGALSPDRKAIPPG